MGVRNSDEAIDAGAASGLVFPSTLEREGRLRPFAQNLAKGFQAPTELPDAESSTAWQDANRSWWESHPMRYDWDDAIAPGERTQDYFREIDRRFFSVVQEFLPWDRTPFDRLIDYPSLHDKDVLEIGVGQGSIAQLLAQAAGRFTGIDLTAHAVESTRRRLELFGLSGRVEQMDAEHMKFDAESFDFLWSWGVIHHSSNTRRIIEEMHRILRPGGRAIIMVYYRGPWNYYAVNGLVHGVFRGEWLRARSVHEIAQSHTDGAIARYYTERDFRELVADRFAVENVQVFGDIALMLPLPGGRLKRAVVDATPKSLARLLGTRLRMGTYLTTTMIKPR